MQDKRVDGEGERWVQLAVARDEQTAEAWAEALSRTGIESEVRIGDAATLTGRSTWHAGVNPAPDSMFAFPLFVPEHRRQDAASILIDVGWDGRYGSRGAGVSVTRALSGALFAILVGAGLAALLVLRGS